MSSEVCGVLLNSVVSCPKTESFDKESRLSTAHYTYSFVNTAFAAARRVFYLGIHKLICHLHDNNVPMGLATSSSIESYQRKSMNHQEFFKFFPYKTYGTTEVKKGKPFPDIFLVAAAKFPDNPAPEKCLVFEDSINGVKAARAAGMQVIMVPDSRLDHSLAPEATQILASMEEFQPELFGLPAYRS